jgi:hypothetical protein
MFAGATNIVAAIIVIAMSKVAPASGRNKIRTPRSGLDAALNSSLT